MDWIHRTCTVKCKVLLLFLVCMDDLFLHWWAWLGVLSPEVVPEALHHLELEINNNIQDGLRKTQQ